MKAGQIGGMSKKANSILILTSREVGEKNIQELGEPDPWGSMVNWLDSDWINVTARHFTAFWVLIYLIRGQNDKNNGVLANVPLLLPPL